MKAPKKLVLLLLCLCTMGWACSQKTWQVFVSGPEAVYFPTTETAKTDVCRETINYAPSLEYPEHTPMRYVQLRFLIMQNHANDPNTIQPYEAVEYVRNWIGIVNYKLTLNERMSLPPGNETPVIPINYRFVVHKDPNVPGDTGIDFAQDSTMAYFNYKNGKTGSYDRRAYDKYAKYKNEVLTVVMQEHHPDSIKSKTYSATSTGTGFPDWIKIVGAKQFLDTIIHPDGRLELTGHRANIFKHETGHSFGLMHTWNGNDGCDDTPNHPNCWDQNSANCPDGIYSNNMMDYNNSQHALTPCQLGIINYNFSRLGSAQRKYLQPNWCNYKKDSTINIYSPNVVWNSAKDLEGDIVIHNGGSLTIHCRVSLPAGAKIIIKPKGTLILDGAQLTNLCNQQWEGIELWGNNKEQGKLIVYKMPSINNAVHPVLLNKP